jgi:hypothetical protein
MARSLTQFFRAPRIIVAEIAAIVLACAVGATIPQVDSSSPGEIVRFVGRFPLLHASLVEPLGLDRVFRSPWFLGLLLLSGCSLLIVIREQIRLLRRSWKQTLTEAHFARAPFRVEFVRAVRRGSAPADGRATTIARQGRLSLAGSALFHVGLLLVLVAGISRAALGTGAVVDLFEGETLPPGEASWGQQWSGALGRSFSLGQAVTLERVEAGTYPSGGLRQLRASLRDDGSPAGTTRHVGINEDLSLDGRRLYVSSTYGPVALMVVEVAGSPPEQRALLMNPDGTGYYEASFMRGDHVVHVRTRPGAGSTRPVFVDVRVMDGPALAWAGVLRVGETAAIGANEQISLAGLRLWIRLWGSHDPAIWIAWAGVVALIAGSILMLALVGVDSLVAVSPCEQPDMEHVLVAMKPQRFAPLFKDDFHRLVKREGGDA